MNSVEAATRNLGADMNLLANVHHGYFVSAPNESLAVPEVVSMRGSL